MLEQWKSVPEDELYAVSSLGRVASLFGGKTRVLALRKAGLGYPCIKIRGRTRYIHRLVLEAFVGPCPDGMECRHLDGDRTNNRLDNLCWGTPVDNWNDKFRHGTAVPARAQRTDPSKTPIRGSRHWLAKLTEDKVAQIRSRLAAGEKGNALAREYGVSPSVICVIRKGRAWNHVTHY